MKRFSSIAGATSIALACLVSSTSAAVITQTKIIPLDSVPFNINLPFAAAPSVGLTGITITLNTWSRANIEIFNPKDVASAYSNASASIPVTATGPGGAVVVNVLTSTSAAGVILPGPGVTTIPGPLVFLSQSVNVLPPGLWPLYTSGGLFNVNATAGSGLFAGTSPAGMFFGGSADVYGDVTIDFTYAAVPEPSTYVAGLSALGMLGMFGMRNRKQA